jgi:hypothetical protein
MQNYDASFPNHGIIVVAPIRRRFAPFDPVFSTLLARFERHRLPCLSLSVCHNAERRCWASVGLPTRGHKALRCPGPCFKSPNGAEATAHFQRGPPEHCPSGGVGLLRRAQAAILSHAVPALDSEELREWSFG